MPQADADPDRDQHEIAATGGGAEPVLGRGQRPDIVLDHSWQARCRSRIIATSGTSVQLEKR